MTSKPESPVRLLTRANEARCQNCPPERVCAWACVQGTSYPDIVIGAALEQSQSWVLELPVAEPDSTELALWEVFNS